MRITYEMLKQEWEQALDRCGFIRFYDTVESLNWNDMHRCVESGVAIQPLGTTMGGGMFSLGVKLQWGWSALQTARYFTTEDDALIQMIGHDNLRKLSLPTTEEDAQSELGVHIEITVHVARNRAIYPAQFDLNGLATGIVTRVRQYFENVKDHEPESPTDPYFYVCWTHEPHVLLRWTADGFVVDAIVVEVYERCLLPRAWDWAEEFYPIDPIDEQLDGLLGRAREAMLSIITFLDNFHRR
jgi:hypothetical protein